ncbi:phosphatase, partial [Moraxella catarrhalis]|uniref:alkaline phosphatase PhoX n=1 Tax=Moraxella catarrhalis TaxID=480 RepID=UPI00128AE951
KFDPKQSKRSLLAINHENTNENLHPMGIVTLEDNNAAPMYRKKRLAMDVRRDANAHGVTVVELRKTGDRCEMVKNSPFNKRFSSATTVDFAGAAAGSKMLITKFDKSGKSTWGINNQCGAGMSPWGTYL